MNKFVSTLVLSVSAILATSAAMAAPDHRQDDRRYHAQHQDSRWNDNKHSGNWNNNNRYDNRYDNNRYNSRVNPSRDWRVGQTLPRAMTQAVIKSVIVKHVVYRIQAVTNSGTKSMVTMSS